MQRMKIEVELQSKNVEDMLDLSYLNKIQWIKNLDKLFLINYCEPMLPRLAFYVNVKYQRNRLLFHYHDRQFLSSKDV